MKDSKVAKSFVRPDNTIVLTCPHCDIQKVVKADLFKGRKHKLKVKCLCEKAFTVNLDFRYKVRKKVKLKGTYINHSQEDKRGNLFVEDISMGGLAFTHLDGKVFNVGDELSLKFTLDDEHKTVVGKKAIVINIHPISTGCEFVNSEEFSDSSLNKYIKSTLL